MKLKYTRQVIAITLSIAMLATPAQSFAIANEQTPSNANPIQLEQTVETTQKKNEGTAAVPTTESQAISPLAGSTRATTYGKAQFKQEPPAGPAVDELFTFGTYSGRTVLPYVEPNYPNVAVVAQDQTFQGGYLWSKKKLDLTKPFSTEMQLYLAKGENSPTPLVGDGMAFILQNDARGMTALGSAGGLLGAYTGGAEKGIQNAVFVEFDTYFNRGNDQEPFVQNVDGQITVYTKNKTGKYPVVADIPDYNVTFKLKQEWLPFRAEWTPTPTPEKPYSGNLTVSFMKTDDGNWDNTVAIPIDDFKDTFGLGEGESEVIWGFTGATGSATAVHAAAITKLPDQKLDITKTVYKDGKEIQDSYVNIGDKLTYTIESVSSADADPEGISQVLMQDDLPIGLSYVADSGKVEKKDAMGASVDARSIAPTINGQQLSFATQVELQKKGETVSVTFDVMVTADAYGKELKNTALVYTDKQKEEDRKSTEPATVKTYADYKIKKYYEDKDGKFVERTSEEETISKMEPGTVIPNIPTTTDKDYIVDDKQTNSSFTVGETQENNVWNVYYRYKRSAVQYATDGNGQVDRTQDTELRPIDSLTSVGKQLPNVTPNAGYTFSHWEYKDAEHASIQITEADLVNKKIDTDLFITAYFRKADAPTINSKKSTEKWTNQDVIVEYTVDSTTDPLKTVQENQKAVSGVSGNKYTGKITYTENGSGTISAETTLGLKATDHQITVTNIDKIAPTITIGSDLAKSTIKTAKDITDKVTFADPLDKDNRASGINDDTRTIIVIDEKGVKEEILFKDLTDGKIATWKSGKYKVAFIVEDNATNKTISAEEMADMPEIFVNVGDPTISPTFKTIADNALYANNTWTSSDVAIVVDFNGGGVNLTEIVENNKKETVNASTVSKNSTLKEEGIYPFAWSTTNEAGKTAMNPVVSTSGASYTVKIDRSAPIITENVETERDYSATEIKTELDKVKFEDPKISGQAGSGVKDSSKTIYLFTKNASGQYTLSKTIPFNKIETDWPNDGEAYYYAISVEDQVGNYRDSTGKTVAGNETTKKEPNKPSNDKPIFAGAQPPTLNATMKTGTENYTGSWTNKPVTVHYDATSKMPLTSVTEKIDTGAEKNATSGKYAGDVKNLYEDGKVIVEKEGTTTVILNAKNKKGMAGDTKTIFIDKTAPVIEKKPTKGGTFNGSSFEAKDPTPAGVDRISDLDTIGSTIVLIPIVNGSPQGSGISVAYGDKGSMSSNSAIKEGQKYQVIITAKDNAGNVTTETINDVTYIEDPDKAGKDKNITATKVTTDGGSGTKLDIVSKNYPIESIILQTSDGKKTALQNTLTLTEFQNLATKPSSMEYIWRVKFTGKDVKLIITLRGGSEIVINNAGAGTEIDREEKLLNTTTIPNPLQARDLDGYVKTWQWESSGKNVTDYAIEAKIGNTYQTKTLAQLTALAKRAPQSIYIIVKAPNGQNHYVGDGGKTSTNKAEVKPMTINKG